MGGRQARVSMASEVYEATLLEEVVDEEGGILAAGMVDICANSKFRYLWFFVVYTAFAMPLSFYNQWAITVGQDQYGLSKFLIVPLFFWATGIPFWIRPVWGVTIDNFTENRFGRRRHWIMLGVFGHLILLLPLAFISVGSSPYLWCILLGVALIPRVVAEQGIAALMVEYLPDPGSIGATISYAYRIGSSVIPGLVIMSWWMGGVPFGSPFIDNGVVDFDGIYFASTILVFVGLLAAAAFAVMLREGARLRGPGIEDGANTTSMPVAKSVEEAMEDRALDWPEGTAWWVRLRGAFNNRTAMLGLAVALLMPIGDGMESFFRSYQIEVWGWGSQRIASWSWIFVIAGFLGILGPLISDFIDRRKSMLVWAILAGASYALFSITSVLGMGWQIQLMAWILVMIFSDWLIFTFLATIVEIADPRMAASSMSLFQSAQAIAATGIFITLGSLLLKFSDSYYPLIWTIAILGPAIGFFLIRQMEYPEQDKNRLSNFSIAVKEKISSWLGGPLKLEKLEFRKQGQRMAMAIGLAGVIMLAIIAGLASVAQVEKESVGTLESISTVSHINTTIDSSTQRMGEGQTMNMEIDASAGSVSEVLILVTSSNPSGVITSTDFTWDLTLTSPQDVMIEGENTSSGTVQDADIMAQTELDAESFNHSGFDSTAKAQVWLDNRRGDVDVMYAAGIWEVELTITGDGDSTPFNGQADFTIETTLIQANATVDSVVEENATVTQSEDFGPMLLGVGGLPILALTGGLCWLVLRQDEIIG